MIKPVLTSCYLLFAIVLFGISSWGCKKPESPSPNVVTCKLSSTYSNADPYVLTTYDYNTNGSITKILNYNHQQVYYFEYDEYQRLSKVTTYLTNNTTISSKYTWLNNTVQVEDTAFNSRKIYYIGSNGKFSSMEIYYENPLGSQNYKLFSKMNFEFSSNNLTKISYLDTNNTLTHTTTLTYDDRKCTYYPEELTIDFLFRNENNIKKRVNFYVSDSLISTTEYYYTYNSNNFPVSKYRINNGVTADTIYFDYKCQ